MLPWCLYKILEWHKLDAWGIQQSKHHLLPLDLLCFRYRTQIVISLFYILIQTSIILRLQTFSLTRNLSSIARVWSPNEKAYNEVVWNHKSITKHEDNLKPVVSAFPKGFFCREFSPQANQNWPAYRNGTRLILKMRWWPKSQKKTNFRFWPKNWRICTSLIVALAGTPSTAAPTAQPSLRTLTKHKSAINYKGTYINLFHSP